MPQPPEPGHTAASPPEDVHELLSAVESDRRRTDAMALEAIFRDVSGFEPKVWDGGIVGYGRYDYRYDSGREGTYLATGFAVRRAQFSLYIMPGYADFGDLLERLGKHKTGAACLYINRLSDIDERILRKIIAAGLRNLARFWPVRPE